MRRFFWIVLLTLCTHFPSLAQLAKNNDRSLFSKTAASPIPPIELYTRGFGGIVGIQQGRYTFFELGGEANWRTIRLSHPKTYGVGGNLEYNFGQSTFGLKTFGWIKPARFDFTYGANVMYYTNRNGGRFGIGPSLGYKLLGFHLMVGANLLAGSREMQQYNPFYFTIRYFAPIQKKTAFRKSKSG